MKKLTFILGAVTILALASCSKEKDCSCVSSYSGTGVTTPSITGEVHITDGDCSDLDTKTSAGGITVQYSCTEK